MEGLENCIAIVQQVRERYTQELRELTGNPEITGDMLEQIKEWSASQGFKLVSLDAEHTDIYLSDNYAGTLPPHVRRAIEIRKLLSSRNVDKVYALQRYANSDGRIRGCYQYYGAQQTGRWAGRGPQLQNLASSGPPVTKCNNCGYVQWEGVIDCRNCGNCDDDKTDWGIDAIENCLNDIKTRDLRHIEHKWGDALKAVAGCLRGLLVAAPGKELLCSDYSAIEAVVLACLAGEEWRIEVFRTHGKIYEMSAAKISGVPFEEFLEHKKRTGQHHKLRKTIGKVAELASGYSGWINAWKNFGAGDFMDDQEIKENILKWREESPMIVEFWGGQWRKHPRYWEFTQEYYGVEGCAVLALMNPGKVYSYRGIKYMHHTADDVLYCRLLSGRYLVYHTPRLEPGTAPHGHPIQKISFYGWNSNHKVGPFGWIKLYTYGGKLTENIVQATARDCFAAGMVNVEAAGYPIVLHTHDEIAAEIDAGTGSIEELEELMGVMPEWCADWPIKAAGGWRGVRYRKE